MQEVRERAFADGIFTVFARCKKFEFPQKTSPKRQQMLKTQGKTVFQK
jgi:hypothetical protein